MCVDQQLSKRHSRRHVNSMRARERRSSTKVLVVRARTRAQNIDKSVYPDRRQVILAKTVIGEIPEETGHTVCHAPEPRLSPFHAAMFLEARVINPRTVIQRISRCLDQERALPRYTFA